MSKTKCSNLLTVTTRNSSLFRVYATPDGGTEVASVDGLFLKLLSQVLGFRYKLVLPSDGEWGRLSEDGTWTGMLGMIVKGEADIGISYLTITEKRQKAVDFSIPYTNSPITFITDMPELLSRQYLFLYPFDNWTWICFLVMLFCVPIVLHKIYRSKNSYWRVLLMIWGNILRQPISDRAFRGKLLIAMFWILFSIVSLSYSAVILSFLTVPLTEPPIRNVEELLKATKKGECDVFTLHGNAGWAKLKSSFDPKVREIADIIEKNGWYLVLEKLEELYSSNEGKRKHAVFADRFGWVITLALSQVSEKYVSNEDVVWDDIGIALKKNFSCKERFNLMIERVRQSGLYDKFMKDEIYKSWIRSHESKFHAPAQYVILIGDISGALFTLVFGYCLALVAFIFEMIIFKTKYRHLLDYKVNVCYKKSC